MKSSEPSSLKLATQRSCKFENHWNFYQKLLFVTATFAFPLAETAGLKLNKTTFLFAAWGNHRSYTVIFVCTLNIPQSTDHSSVQQLFVMGALDLEMFVKNFRHAHKNIITNIVDFFV